eukprot:m.153156 g.153156  ORF g.153156 m.153156 type:complete len:1368 (-) comp11709_c0_seq1:4205-8308(-)
MSGAEEAPDVPKRQQSTISLSAESQAVFRGTHGRKGSSLRGGSGGKSLTRVGTFLHVLTELAQPGTEGEELGNVLREALVDDVKLTKADIRRLIGWFKDVEMAIEHRPTLDVMEKQFSLESIKQKQIEKHDNGAILVFGGIAMDMIGEVDHFPTPNSTLEASDFRTAPGGKGANEAVACGNLGTTVYVVGRVGNDDFGRTMVKRLAAYVNTNGIAVDDTIGTGFALIVTASDTQQKTNTICKGANESVGDTDLATVEDLIQKVPSIHIMLLTLDAGDHDNVVMSRAATIGHAAKKLVILRASPLAESRGIVPALWDNSSIIIVTETEAAVALAVSDTKDVGSFTPPTPLRTLQQCAEAARLMLRRSQTTVAVIVSSAMGVSCRLNVSRIQKLHRSILEPGSPEVSAEVDDGDEYTITLPCFRGPVVDVVGAVDALTGGIAAALTRGVPLSHALVWGTACCDRSISEHGAQDSMPSKDQLLGFFRMVGVSVAVDHNVGGPGVWPTAKPAVGATVRHLEEMLHSGSSSAFCDALDAFSANTPSGNVGRDISVAVDFQGNTLLHLAVLYCDLQSAVMLISHGADVGRKDNYGKTPLERCNVEYQAARRQARDRFALIKFCLVCVDQVNRFTQGFASSRSEEGRGSVVSFTSSLSPIAGDPSPPNAPDGNASGTESPAVFDWPPEDDPPPARSARSSAPDASSMRDAQAATHANLHTYAELTDKIDCGNDLSPLLMEGWAYSLLSLMTLSIDESMGCEEHRSGLFALSNFLTLQILSEPSVRETAIKIMGSTSLRKSGTKFSHGLAHSGTDEVLKSLLRGSVPLDGDKRTPEATVEVEETDSGDLKTMAAVVEAATSRESTSANRARRVSIVRTVNKLTSGWRFVRDCLQRSRETDNQGRSLLHYAMMGENAFMCGQLLNWGHDMYARDMQGSTPMSYCQNHAFADHVKKLQLVTDAFLSVGHTGHTDRIIQILVEEAKKEQLKLWWDKGGQEDGPGIRPGEPWTSEIEKAMKKCKVCVVILTKKWVNSKYCKGEAMCALSYNKQIITIMPPVPVEERASVDDLPKSALALKGALMQRQIVDFSDATDAEFIAALPHVFQVIENVTPVFSQTLFQEETDLADSTARISDVILPRTASLRWATDKHVFIVCGASNKVRRDSAFARLLANQLVKSGVPVSLGFKPSETVPDSDYADLLRKRIEGCDFLAIVVEETSDFDFLNSVAHQACTAGTKVMVLPYWQMSESQGGFGYTAHLTSPATCCFTDWMGTGLGLLESSPIFHELFEDFLVKLDALHAEATTGVIRRRSSVNMLTTSGGSGFSIVGSLSEESPSPPGSPGGGGQRSMSSGARGSMSGASRRQPLTKRTRSTGIS